MIRGITELIKVVYPHVQVAGSGLSEATTGNKLPSAALHVTAV